MKIFISSVIQGMEEFRAAAAAAAEALGHTVLQAEEFAASPSSPRVACLAGVREADAVILLLGERYGAEQDSGLSATHEEYREARERCPVFAFVQSGVSRSPNQEGFLQEVQAWSGGHYTNSFTSPKDLQKAVTLALHRWELSLTGGLVADPTEMMQRASELVGNVDVDDHRPALAIALVGGPLQSVMRPSELEDPKLRDALLQEALFGEAKIFTHEERTEASLEGHALRLQQDRRLLRIDEQGSILQLLPLGEDYTNRLVIVEEDVRDKLTTALKFASLILDRVDESERLSNLVVVVSLTGVGYHAWRTRREHEASPDSVSLSMSSNEPSPVHLSPPHRTRAVFRLNQATLVEDLITLLKRSIKR